MQNIRIFNFGIKNVLFGCFGEQLWKSVVIFVISALLFVLKRSLVQKKKSLNFGLKVPNLRTFVLGFENALIIFEISTL